VYLNRFISAAAVIWLCRWIASYCYKNITPEPVRSLHSVCRQNDVNQVRLPFKFQLLTSRGQLQVYHCPCGIDQAMKPPGHRFQLRSGMEGNRVTNLCDIARLGWQVCPLEVWHHVRKVSCDDGRWWTIGFSTGLRSRWWSQNTFSF